MKTNSGFTLLELMITVAIVAILSGIAIPNFIQWRNNAKFRDGLSTLTSDLASAKQSAIRLNADTVTAFTAGGYTIFVDNGAGTLDTNADFIPDGLGDGVCNGTEQVLRSRTLPAGVLFSSITFVGNLTRFDTKGQCPTANAGTVVLSGGVNQSTISVNRLGRISVN